MNPISITHTLLDIHRSKLGDNSLMLQHEPPDRVVTSGDVCDKHDMLLGLSRPTRKTLFPRLCHEIQLPMVFDHTEKAATLLKKSSSKKDYSNKQLTIVQEQVTTHPSSMTIQSLLR